MEEKAVVEVPAKFKDIVAGVEKLTLIELHELVKLLEEKWGVSAAAAVVAGPAAGGAAAAEEKDSFDLELTAAGPRIYGGSYDEYVASTGREAPGMRAQA